MAREPVPHIENIIEQLETGADHPDSDAITALARAYLRRFPDEWSTALPPAEMAAQITRLFEFIDERGKAAIAVRVFNPTADEWGYALPGAVVESVADDRPAVSDRFGQQRYPGAGI